MVKTYWHFDHIVVGWNALELRTKTREVLDLIKIVKVVYFLSPGLGVLEVQFGQSKRIEVNIHLIYLFIADTKSI